METLVANITGKVRRETLDGRRYLVAPVVLMRGDSVMNGSKGALFYPSSEVAKRPGMWNHIPITDGHPTENGSPVSARSAKVLERYKLGIILNDRMSGSDRVAEAWYDEELTRNKSPKTYQKLTENTPFDLSTGLMTENVVAANGSQAKGRSYSHVARNYDADHVASLVDQVGACSLKDGCGVLVGNVCELDENDICMNCGGPGSGKPGPCPTGDGYSKGRKGEYEKKSDHHAKESSKARKKADKEQNPTERKRLMDLSDHHQKLSNTWANRASAVHNAEEQSGPEKVVCSKCGEKHEGECSAVTNEDKRSLWRQLGDMLGITTTENAFCPTGKGGGQDNSCSSTEGGSDSSEVKGKPIPDSPYGIPQGQTVKFHDGEFKGYEVQLQGLIRKNLSRKEDDVHRGQIVGIKGGAGEITVSHSTLKKYATLTANQSTEGDAMPTPTNKEELVSYLTTNCSCHKGKEKVLNTLDEETLAVLKTQHEELAANQLVVNALRESDPTLKDIAVNELPAAFKKKSPTAAKETCPDCGYPVGPDHVCPPKKTTMNKLAPASERLTPEEIETLEIAREVTQNSKSQLLDLVVNANASNDAAKKAIRPLYEKLSYKELKTLADNLPKGRPTTNDDHGDLLLNFFTGASGGGHHTTNRGSEPDPNDVLEPFYTPAKS